MNTIKDSLSEFGETEDFPTLNRAGYSSSKEVKKKSNDPHSARIHNQEI